MSLDRKQIESQLASFEAQRERAIQAVREAQEAVHQLTGGINTCQHWLTLLAKQDVPTAIPVSAEADGEVGA